MEHEHSYILYTTNERFKADMVVHGEHSCAVADALNICKFSTTEEYSLLPDDVGPGLAALWDEPVTGEDLLLIGERIVNLERLYNVPEGLSRADDRLPDRFICAAGRGTASPLRPPYSGWG